MSATQTTTSDAGGLEADERARLRLLLAQALGTIEAVVEAELMTNDSIKVWIKNATKEIES